MNKNKKIIIALVVALLFALLAGVAVTSFLKPRRTTIYVFKNNYPIGTQVMSDMLIPVQVDSSMIIAGRNTKVNDMFITNNEIKALLESGDSLKISVGQGTPLMKSILSISGGNNIVMSMKPSSVAVTVPLDDVTGISKDLYSGANVNVYVTSYTGGTFLLFENMRVLEVDRKQNGSLYSATLEVDNSQAVKVINSLKNGSIHLGLINPTGYVYEDGDSSLLINPDNIKEPEEENKENENQDLIVPDELSENNVEN